MARIALFSIPGLECYFPAGDHPPPHFHVRKPGAWEIKVSINHVHRGDSALKYVPVRPRRPARKRQVPTTDELEALRAAVLIHRRALLREFVAMTAGIREAPKVP